MGASLHPLPQSAEPRGQGLPWEGSGPWHGPWPLPAGMLATEAWDVESRALARSSPGLKRVGCAGEGRDFSARAGTVPGAWGCVCLSLPCTGSTGKGLWAALVKVFRCWGPA